LFLNAIFGTLPRMGSAEDIIWPALPDEAVDRNARGFKVSLDFALPDQPAAVSGFGRAERLGRWTDGPDASLALPLGDGPEPFILVTFEIRAFVHRDQLLEQNVAVSVDGAFAARWVQRGHMFRKRMLVIKRAALREPSQATIDLHLPNCAQPSALQINQDPRFLGLLLNRVDIEAVHEKPGEDSPLWHLGRPVGGEAAKTFDQRLLSGFWSRYITGPRVLDIGFRGYGGTAEPIVEGAIGIDTDYPGYDGKKLPFQDGSQDAVFSSHCLEHIPGYVNAIQDWFRVTRIGGHIITVVPDMYLYERRRRPPSRRNPDHQRFYTPSSLLAEFEQALEPNTYRVRLLEENDTGYRYEDDPSVHPAGCYEIMLVIQKITPPAWHLAD